MATREQIVQKLANRRVASHYLPNLSRAQVRQAAQGLTNEQWDTIIGAVRTRKVTDIGEVLRLRVIEHLRGLALADIEAALVPDDTLTVAELEGLL